MGRQQLKDKTASDEDGRREALEGRISVAGGPHTLANQQRKDDILPLSTPAAVTDAFKMDSDTDLEEEEEGVTPATPVTSTVNQRADRTSGRAQVCAGSDTDAEENDDAPRRVPESAPPPENETRSLPANPEGTPSDSDTDVEGENVLDAGSMAKTTPIPSKSTAGSGPAARLKRSHLDSDTEGEEEDTPPAQSNSSQTNRDLTETPSKSAEALSAEAEGEAAPAPPIGKSAVTEWGPAADAYADLDILSDSGTDVEPDSPPAKQRAVGPDVGESGSAPVLERVTVAGPHEEGQQDVEDEGAVGAPGEGQLPRLVREGTPGLPSSSHQYCSTPVQLPGKWSHPVFT